MWEQIDQWEEQQLKLDLEELKYHQRIYTKAELNPYSNYPSLNITHSAPSGKTRKKILTALLNIYESWNEQLQAFREPYYLKIWLYEPYITKSQVICATGDFIEFYKNSFFKPAADKRMPVENYGILQKRIEKLSWEYAIHEEVVSETDIGERFEFDSETEYFRNKKQVVRRIQNSFRKTSQDGTSYYHTKYGAVWIGGNF